MLRDVEGAYLGLSGVVVCGFKRSYGDFFGV